MSDADFLGQTAVPSRCIGCGYVLEHIASSGRCPECGRDYDLRVPFTYTRKPPFVRSAYWLPGFLTSFGVGAGLYLLLVPAMGWGWATTLIVPMTLGLLLGYGISAGIVAQIIFGLLLMAGLAGTLMTANLTGGLCTLILGLLAVLPALFGMALGVMLRSTLKETKFSQRHWLPLAVLVPVAAAAIEGRHDGMAIVSTHTVATINATPEQTWRAVQFYEQVRHRPPLLLWVSPSLRPRYTTGSSAHVGDRKICVYERGHLVKEITEVVPGKRLAFRVVEQTDIENDGVTLIDGSFDLTPTADGRGTVVTLTTRYQPKLAPRFAYKPAEDWAVHTLHGHVLRGMRDDAEATR